MKRMISIFLLVCLLLWPVCVMAQQEAGDATAGSDPGIPLSAEALVTYVSAVAEASKLPSCLEVRNAIDAIPEDIRHHAATILFVPEKYDLGAETLHEIRRYVRVAASNKGRCPAVVEAFRALAADIARQKQHKADGAY